MKKLYFLKSAFFLIAIFANMQSAKSQSFIDVLTNNLNAYHLVKTPEKVYLQFDKVLYTPGEKVWFKTYLVNGVNHKLNGKSSFVYVELLNPNGTVKVKKNLHLLDGISYDFFELDGNIKGGIYKIRAYTLWMKNFDDAPIFEKNIIVQKVLIPKVLLTLDFDKEAYGAGQHVIADLEIKDLTNEPLKFYPVIAKILIDNNLLTEVNLTTDVEGLLNIPFDLPENLTSNDGILTVSLVYDNQIESITRSIPIVLNNIDLVFFPEGGYIVAGTQNRIAFEALNEYGLPADVEGVILDQNNNIVQSFSSFHQGMGAFTFVPNYNNTYKAKILKPQELDTLYDLPASFSGGFVLTYKNTTSSSLNFDVYASARQRGFIVATIRDSIRYMINVNLSSGINNFAIPNNKLTDGIVRITLFNAAGAPECERLVYYGTVSPMQVKITVPKNRYGINEPTDLQISTSYNGKPVSADLSLSIVDDKNITFIDDKQDNILSWFLMSSELKGKIYEPSYYFDADEDSSLLALDYLLMTHGWRGFKWKDILNTKPAVTIAAETNASFAGQVFDNFSNKGVMAEVWVFELDNDHRAASLETTKDGYFYFTNIDPTSRYQIVAKTKRRNHNGISIIEKDNFDPQIIKIVAGITDTNFNFIKWDYQLVAQNYNNSIDNKRFISDTLGVPVIQPQAQIVSDISVRDIQFNNDNSDLMFNQIDDAQLDEVVVTALGIKTDAKSVGYSVQDVSGDFLTSVALQGKVAGVNITNSSGAVGASSRIVLRGNSTIVPDGNPLIVVDGVPLDFQISIDNTINSAVDPSQIQNISFIEGNTSSVLYGTRAQNGAIVISTTNSNIYDMNSIDKNRSSWLIKQPKYSITNDYTSRVYYNTKEYWQQVNQSTVRNATVYWNADVRTDASGNATVSVFCPDEVSSYKITTEGVSANGNIGRAEAVMNVVKPVSIITKIPYELTYNDTISIPVVVKNSTLNEINGQLVVNHTTNFKLLGNRMENIVVSGDTSVKVNFTFVALPQPGVGRIKINFNHPDYPEEFEYDVKVNPKGFPIVQSFSSDAQKETFIFNIDEPLTGSLTGSFTLYVNVLDDMLSGLAGMLRAPMGCFEQTTSFTYPNILVLDILQQTGNSDQQLQQTALNYIDAGYKRLTGFETAQKGFEWFGNTPPHEGLTSMGIMEFTDMKRVYGGVDENMLQRTKDWLMTRRDGNGNFNFSTKFLHTWITNQEVTNAYVVFALAKSGIDEIEKEYQHAKNEAVSSKDPYRLGLIANAAFYLNKNDDLDELIQEIDNQLSNKSFNELTIAPSITSSTGTSLKIETASLYLMALLKQDIKNNFQIEQTLSYLYSNRTNGYFGSTQGTILALSALSDYYKLFTGNPDDNIDVLITINGTEIRKTFNKSDRANLSIDNLSDYITTDGQQVITVKFLSDETIPYSVDFGWHSLHLSPDNQCKIALQTGLQNQNVKVGDNVRMDVFIENTSDEVVPMTVAEIGIPSGLSLQPWQLQEFSKKQLWDYYEIFDGKLVVYYTALDANEKRHIKLDLKADLSGVFTAKASSAYLYYTNEYKDWNKGTLVWIVDM
ncbi:MAG: hypothetical protein JXR68_10060 [Bacteroidales bacterium]|nr:hypothetical protein [Bacteroidales bacterium]